MSFKVQVVYFRSNGHYCAVGDYMTAHDELPDIWEEVHELRRMGRLPGLRPNAGRDLIALVDVVGHPVHRPHLCIPPLVQEEDVTPMRVPTVEMVPLVIEIPPLPNEFDHEDRRATPRDTQEVLAAPAVADDSTTPPKKG